MLETPGEAIFLRVHPDWRDDQAAAIRRSGCSSLRVTLRGSPLSSRPVAAAGSAVAMIPPRLRLADPAAHGARRTCSGELMFASRRAVVFDSSARPRLDLGRVYRFRSTSLAAMPLRHLAADSGDVLLEQRGAKLRESLRRRVIQRAEDRFPFLYLQGEDASTAAVHGFQISRRVPGRRSDGRARERRGRGSEVRRGTWRAQCAPSVADCAGSAARSPEPTSGAA